MHCYIVISLFLYNIYLSHLNLCQFNSLSPRINNDAAGLGLITEAVP